MAGHKFTSDRADMAHQIKETEGYYPCCGKSRLRGHDALCPKKTDTKETPRGR